ncbi:polysaccharide pyruvyl transferase family protein [Lentibacter sp. XHP0401]|uniref:polysaccharide pyruvyl transferase family protein n=1 Tax=Lentibacter sp. XHP0401 TaxID=2984334 RepID=UPI0021E8463D|nr:polysaccharide pyruvyl transferase family protein [Lentibacter sp. XHP0401]MCV2893787.1 polysaccharide pyruvyl transferase family protein [Lentibacter sp. XHP0401]
MLDAFLLHHRNTDNVGDLSCSPHDYFDFGKAAVADFGSPVPPTHRLIMGGGQIWKSCVRTQRRGGHRAKHSVIWGVGIGPQAVRSPEYTEMRESCALIGTRCAGLESLGARYVPCASAMSAHFESAPAPSHELVMFAHAKYSDDIPRLAGTPEMNNTNVSLKDAIHFIASGETVLTNSYHGTYWALLLGRRVICIPFSQKMRFFPDPPTLAKPHNWQKHIGKAQRAEGALEKARALSRAFYDDVMNLS